MRNSDIEGATVDNIVCAFLAADAETRYSARDWYSQAHEIAREIMGLGLAEGAGVLAVLSPMLSWPRNVALAREVAGGADSAACLANNLAKAIRIRNGECPADVVRGPKVHAFWSNIVDPFCSQTVVIDRHAIDIAFNVAMDDDSRSKYFTKGRQNKLQELYRSAAVEISDLTGEAWSPSMVQACSWIWWRENHARAFHGNLVDSLAEVG